MTSASMQRTRPGAPARIQWNRSSSSGYTPNFRRPPGSGIGFAAVHGYLHVASRLARVRLRPKLRPAASNTLGSSRRHDAQRLRVALESADVRGPVVQRSLAVVPERRMAEVVAQARGVDDVRRQPQRGRELAAHLRDLERVRETVAGEVRRTRGAQHLRLRGQAAQRRRMEDAGAVAREVVALRAVVLAVEALGIRVVVAGRVAPRRCPPRRRRQPPLWSSSASASSQDASTPRSRESSHPSGSAGRLGVPARPRWPSAAAPG